MLSWLSDIWHAIMDLPYLLVALLVEALNALIAALAALAELVLGLLPGFPDPPSGPDSGIGALLLWVVPLGPILSVFTILVSCWVSFLAVKIALRWVKAL